MNCQKRAGPDEGFATVRRCRSYDLQRHRTWTSRREGRPCLDEQPVKATATVPQTGQGVRALGRWVKRMPIWAKFATLAITCPHRPRLAPSLGELASLALAAAQWNQWKQWNPGNWWNHGPAQTRQTPSISALVALRVRVPLQLVGLWRPWLLATGHWPLASMARTHTGRRDVVTHTHETRLRRWLRTSLNRTSINARPLPSV